MVLFGKEKWSPLIFFGILWFGCYFGFFFRSYLIIKKNTMTSLMVISEKNHIKNIIKKNDFYIFLKIKLLISVSWIHHFIFNIF